MKSLDGASPIGFLPRSVVSICLSTILISQEIKVNAKLGGEERKTKKETLH